MTIYTPKYYGTVNQPSLDGKCVEIPAKLVDATFIEAGKNITMEITGEPTTTGTRAIGSDEFMLVAKGTSKEALAALTVGTRLTLYMKALCNNEEVFPKDLCTGNPWILHNGNVLDSENDRGDASARHPRSGIGYNADKTKLLMMVIDGRSAISSGVQTSELAHMMYYAGVDEAINVDGGGSSTLWTINGKKFDSSRGGTPFAMRLSDLIDGWIVAIDIIVIDSVAALTPKAEIEGEMGDNKVGLQARLMSQALRKLTGNISKTNTCCIFINQLREKIGVMFGNPETTTGGNALKFYASVRLDVRRTTQIKDGEEALGNRTKVKVVKNKMAPPFKKAEFDIVYGEGISHTGEIVDLGVEYGIITKSGSWFSYGDQKLAQGREATKQLISDNAELSEEIEAKIREALKHVED